MSKTTQVKQEKKTQQDDSEYDEWAKKLVEKPTPQIGVLQNSSGSTAPIFGTQSNSSLTSQGIPSNWGFDRDSAIGKFTWRTIGEEEDKFVPAIYRNDEEFVSVRMVEIFGLNDFLNVLPMELFESIKLTAYYATPAEIKILNYINNWHCDGFYGTEQFTQFDLIVKFEDLLKLYDYCQFAYLVLHSGGKLVDKECTNCGFVKVNTESLIPYAVLETGERGVPLFYFEGQTDVLKAKAQPLGGWPLAYLKVCCKVQGVRKDLISNATLQIVTLADLQAYFPKRTVFTEKCWPSPKNKTLLPKAMITNVLQSPTLQVSSDKWTKLEVNETFPNYRPSPPLQKTSGSAATISTVVISPKNGSAPANVTLNVNGVRTNREIPKQVQSRSHLAQIKITSRPMDKSKLVVIPEHPDGSKEGAYVVRLIVVENEFMHCVNSMPGKGDSYLVVLQQFMEALFPNVSIYPTAVSILRNQDIVTYLPNSAQLKALNNVGFQFQENWQAPLIQAHEAQGAITKLRGIMKPRPVQSTPANTQFVQPQLRVANGGSSTYGRSYARR